MNLMYLSGCCYFVMSPGFDFWTTKQSFPIPCIYTKFTKYTDWNDVRDLIGIFMNFLINNTWIWSVFGVLVYLYVHNMGLSADFAKWENFRRGNIVYFGVLPFRKFTDIHRMKGMA